MGNGAPAILAGGAARLMGILNITPDSFSDGGRWLAPDRAVAQGAALAAAGAAVLDIGGESTRPGAAPVDADIEAARVVPVIAALRSAGVPAALSIDTSKATVAHVALAAGATIVNDVSAGADPGMFAAVAAAGAGLVLMHRQGAPATMQVDPRYDDPVREVCAFLAGRVAAATAAGVPHTAITVDPGIGFGKRPEDNRALLRGLDRVAAATGCPVLVGVSRKSFFAPYLPSGTPAPARDGLSHVLHAWLARRCAWLRVHDVAGAAAALRLVEDLA
jgi:dihydropteroate synthase